MKAHQINNNVMKFGQNRACNYACRFMRRITRGFMRKAVNLPVELGSDGINVHGGCCSNTSTLSCVPSVVIVSNCATRGSRSFVEPTALELPRR